MVNLSRIKSTISTRLAFFTQQISKLGQIRTGAYESVEKKKDEVEGLISDLLYDILVDMTSLQTWLIELPTDYGKDVVRDYMRYLEDIRQTLSLMLGLERRSY